MNRLHSSNIFKVDIYTQPTYCYHMSFVMPSPRCKSNSVFLILDLDATLPAEFFVYFCDKIASAKIRFRKQKQKPCSVCTLQSRLSFTSELVISVSRPCLVSLKLHVSILLDTSSIDQSIRRIFVFERKAALCLLQLVAQRQALHYQRLIASTTAAAIKKKLSTMSKKCLSAYL